MNKVKVLGKFKIHQASGVAKKDLKLMVSVLPNETKHTPLESFMP